tara:strand:- start:5157 stop:5564 length:408 start_codon:yes stop_codon:yes gene_type:complete
MADSVKQYAYYLEGNKIAIVQKNVSFNNNVASKEYGPGVVKSAWESPQESVTDGLKITYTISLNSDIEDESYEFDLPVYLQKALVYYVKAKLAEDEGEIKLKEYAMREFRKMVEKWENSRISGLRITSPGSHAIR